VNIPEAGAPGSSPLTDERSVRDAVRSFIADNFDEQLLLHDWIERLVDSGWAVPTWPTWCFGRGLPASLAATIFDEFDHVAAPGPPTGLAVLLAAPTIRVHGTREQRQRFIRGALVGQHAWCQLFSEPAAGSDLAGVQTKAKPDGDMYIVNGQKVWTSDAHIADYGMLLARTNPDAPKHAGITYFALPMDQPGVDVRPLRQMTGDAVFSEVFLTDVRIPAANVIGELHGGWSVALSTLSNERDGLGAASSLSFPISVPDGAEYRQLKEATVAEFLSQVRSDDTRLHGQLRHRRSSRGVSGAAMIRSDATSLVELARATGRSNDYAVRQQLVRLHTLAQLNRWNAMRSRATARAEGSAGPEASIGKLMSSHIARQWRDTAVEITGPMAAVTGDDGPLDGTVAIQLLAAPGPSIYGGSDQIQRNIIGERVLGLPKEPDPAKGMPCRELLVETQTGRDQTSS
jgi:alkylation response protein AidB-like acyl-CoA dehydrogenase